MCDKEALIPGFRKLPPLTSPGINLRTGFEEDLSTEGLVSHNSSADKNTFCIYWFLIKLQRAYNWGGGGRGEGWLIRRQYTVV